MSVERRRELMTNSAAPDAVLILDLPLVKTKDEVLTTGHTVTENDVIYYPDGALLDENTDYIQVAHNNNLSFTDGTNDKPFSISLDFIRLPNATYQDLISKRDVNNREYEIYLLNGVIYVDLFSMNFLSIYNEWVSSGFTFIDGVNYNIIITYDTTSIKMYVNGISISVNQIPTNNGYTRMGITSAPVYINSFYSGARTFMGSVKNVKIWSGVLSSTQITNLQPIPTIEASATKLFVPYYGNLSDKSNNTKSLISGGSALDYLTKPRWLKSGTNIYQQITSGLTDLTFYSGSVDTQFSVSFKYNFSSNSNVSWFNKSNGTTVEYDVKYDTVLGVVIVLRDNVNNAEYKYTKLFTPIIGSNYAFAFTHSGGTAALGNLKLLINGQLQTATTEVKAAGYVSMNPASGGTQQVNITKLYNGNSEYLNGSIKNLKVESISIPQSTVVKYANDAESYRVLDMQFNNPQEDYLGHTVTDTAMTYSNNQAVFNGSTSKITIANSSDLSFTNGSKDLPFSVATRFIVTTAGDFRLYTNGGLIIYYSSGAIRCDLYSDNTYTIYSYAYINTTFTLGVAYELVVTYDGRGGGNAAQGIKMYINKVSQTLNALPVISNGYTKLFSDAYSYVGGATNLFLNGTIDYCTVYNRVLIQDEIVNGICNVYP